MGSAGPSSKEQENLPEAPHNELPGYNPERDSILAEFEAPLPDFSQAPAQTNTTKAAEEVPCASRQQFARFEKEILELKQANADRAAKRQRRTESGDTPFPSRTSTRFSSQSGKRSFPIGIHHIHRSLKHEARTRTLRKNKALRRKQYNSAFDDTDASGQSQSTNETTSKASQGEHDSSQE